MAERCGGAERGRGGLQRGRARSIGHLQGLSASLAKPQATCPRDIPVPGALSTGPAKPPSHRGDGGAAEEEGAPPRRSSQAGGGPGGAHGGSAGRKSGHRASSVTKGARSRKYRRRLCQAERSKGALCLPGPRERWLAHAVPNGLVNAGRLQSVLSTSYNLQEEVYSAGPLHAAQQAACCRQPHRLHPCLYSLQAVRCPSGACSTCMAVE